MNHPLRVACAALLSLAGFVPLVSSQSATPVTSEPAWPATFTLQGSQVGLYGFAVTQPGPVVITVQTQNAPVNVQLSGPISQPLQRQGAGVVQLTYTVTPQDLQRGLLWQIAVQPLVNPTLQVTGTVGVQHPPVNSAALQATVDAFRAHQPPEMSPQERAQRASSELNQRNAAFRQRLQAADNELIQRRAALNQALQPQIAAMRQSSPSAGAVKTRGLPQALIGSTASTPRISIALPAGRSVAEGVAGDPIMINGNALGAGGEVHFVIGPDLRTQDLVAPALWSGGQIATSVPDPTQVQPYVGAEPYLGWVYVVVGGVKSNFVQFKFDPIIEHRLVRGVISMTPTTPYIDRVMTHADADAYWMGLYGGRPFIRHDRGPDMFSGVTGHDTLDANVTLQHGWVVEGLPDTFSTSINPGGFVAPVLANIGSTSLQTQVFWSVGSYFYGRMLSYSIEIPIKGPKGLPDGVVCTSMPTKDTPCPLTQ